MASSRRSDRRDYDDRYPPRDARIEGGRESKKSRNDLNEFFINGKGINREVLQKEICRFLGPEAHSKPHNYQGIDGFVVKAVRPFTKEMLDDLQYLSKNYKSEREDASRKGKEDFSYGNSQTRRRHDAQVGRMDLDDDPDYDDEDEPHYRQPTTYAPSSGGLSYTSPPGYASQPSGYAAPNYPSGPPGSNLPQHASPYPPGGTYPAGGPYPSGPYASASRPADSPYGYVGNEYGDNYGAPSDPYAARHPGNFPVPPRDNRADPRDPRDPYSSNPRIDPRGVHGDPQFYTAPSGPDMTMPGMSERYPNPSAPQAMNHPRGGGYPSSSRTMPQTPYDRESPRLQDPYRHERPREEGRRR